MELDTRELDKFLAQHPGAECSHSSFCLDGSRTVTVYDVNGNYLATFSVIPKHGAPCPCCGQDECPCSIQDDIEYSDPEVGYRDFVSLCVLHKKRVD